ncbi:hypothetical protein AB6A40_003853 [Gnathostoma spinigerum]|uniref:Uncharacterized protein n=1 Tax=Gnathostoma spinigerum TaxID=75299 RepID=A0ABD6EAR5_9BILA
MIYAMEGKFGKSRINCDLSVLMLPGTNIFHINPCFIIMDNEVIALFILKALTTQKLPISPRKNRGNCL